MKKTTVFDWYSLVEKFDLGLSSKVKKNYDKKSSEDVIGEISNLPYYIIDKIDVAIRELIIPRYTSDNNDNFLIPKFSSATLHSKSGETFWSFEDENYYIVNPYNDLDEAYFEIDINENHFTNNKLTITTYVGCSHQIQKEFTFDIEEFIEDIEEHILEVIKSSIRGFCYYESEEE